MKRLLIDMDGVLSDIYAQFIKYEQKDIGLTQSVKELTGKFEREAFINHDKYVNSENFFYTAIPIQDSVEIVSKLNDAYQVYIVSSAMQFPISLQEKINWLTKYFPFLSWKQIVFCGTKEIVYGDIMIDDHFSNLDNFQGQTILFTQPHNIGKPINMHTRVNTWKEIEKILL
jgi:5'(3')-deoxyribonucleotidase